MKRLTLEATDENILNSIKDNTYNRNSDVKDFIEALDTIEGNMFISLDARWGEGKTFYVRQIEKTLEYLTRRTWGDEQAKAVKELNPYFQNTALNSISLNQSYLPIYYNAWLYDNHEDPLMSLIYTIVKKEEKYIDTALDKSKKDLLFHALSSLSVSLNLGLVQVSANGGGIKDALTVEDILKNINTAEKIPKLVKNILDSVINEKAQRLVIFVDEIDRCRPSYAIEMLERLKHYFDDDRIIFVVSVNKEQLIHTISKYYGYGFDSTGYLNKFFDLNAYLPDPRRYGNNWFYSFLEDQYHLNKISEGLNRYFKLSLRDELIYKQRISMLPSRLVNDYSLQGCCLSMFVPLIIVLEIKDQNEKIRFLEGNSDILEKVSKEVEEIHFMIMRLGCPDNYVNSGNYEKDISEKFNIGFEKIKAVYDYTFKNMDKESYYELGLEVSQNLKQICMKLCNGVER